MKNTQTMLKKDKSQPLSTLDQQENHGLEMENISQGQMAVLFKEIAANRKIREAQAKKG